MTSLIILIYFPSPQDLLEEYNRNVTFKYHHILKHLHEIMMTLRKEEANRLSQIKQFLTNLAKDVNELEVRYKKIFGFGVVSERPYHHIHICITHIRIPHIRITHMSTHTIYTLSFNIFQSLI